MVTFETEPAYDTSVGGVTFRARYNGRRIMCDMQEDAIEDELLKGADGASNADLEAACRQNFERLKVAAIALIESGAIGKRLDDVGVWVERVLIRELQ